jgi:hypothetical protein
VLGRNMAATGNHGQTRSAKSKCPRFQGTREGFQGNPGGLSGEPRRCEVEAGLGEAEAAASEECGVDQSSGQDTATGGSPWPTSWAAWPTASVASAANCSARWVWASSKNRGRSEYRLMLPTGSPCALTGIDSEERTPRASARTAYSHHRRSNTRSSMRTCSPVRIECRHGGLFREQGRYVKFILSGGVAA